MRWDGVSCSRARLRASEGETGGVSMRTTSQSAGERARVTRHAPATSHSGGRDQAGARFGKGPGIRPDCRRPRCDDEAVLAFVPNMKKFFGKDKEPAQREPPPPSTPTPIHSQFASIKEDWTVVPPSGGTTPPLPPPVQQTPSRDRLTKKSPAPTILRALDAGHARADSDGAEYPTLTRQIGKAPSVHPISTHRQAISPPPAQRTGCSCSRSANAHRAATQTRRRQSKHSDASSSAHHPHIAPLSHLILH